MALREAQPEPSMEEILASIRRIISEEGPGDAGAEPSVDLVEPAETLMEDDLLVFEDIAEEAPEPAPVQAPVQAPAQDFRPTAAAVEPEPRAAQTLVSDPAAAATAGSFTRLAGSLRLSDVQGQTLEGMVQELLRPMLREWLDTHLPKIVETKVEAELDRISRLVR